MFGFNKKVEVNTDPQAIDKVLSKGIEAVFPNKDFLKSKMVKGERLTLYAGFDPTGPTLHLGHLITIKKLAEFQKLGHQVYFLIGDFTAMIGDPTGKNATRKKLTREEVLVNCREYQEQASKVISFTGPNKAQLKFNSEWLYKMNFGDVLELASKMTVDQMLKRDMFVRRTQEDKPIYIHEFMYPLMQGYDSVAMDVDIEIGGNDQTFNMLTGRDLMKSIKNKEKFVIAMKLLTDSSGKKMGKTEGNMVSLDQTPEDMFGKIMSWSDNLIVPGFEIITDFSQEEIDSIKKAIEEGVNPKDLKVRLAKEVVTMLFSRAVADKAHEDFEKTFSRGEVSEDAPSIGIDKDTMVRDVLVKEGIVSSNADWKRLVDGNAISVVGTDTVIKDVFLKIETDTTLRVGKKRFVKLIVQ